MNVDAILQAIDNTAGMIALALIVVLGYAAFLFVLLLAGLAIRGAWRCLKRHSWQSVLLRMERKAFR